MINVTCNQENSYLKLKDEIQKTHKTNKQINKQTTQQCIHTSSSSLIHSVSLTILLPANDGRSSDLDLALANTDLISAVSAVSPVKQVG